MSKANGSRINPYIATTDVMIGLVLVFVVALVATTAVGASREAQLRGISLTGELRSHERAAEQVRVRMGQLPVHLRPSEDDTRNDPTGTQRWRFEGTRLFVAHTTTLTDDGRAMVNAFGQVLTEVGTWRRIRVEGHTRKTPAGGHDDWARSAALAVAVVEELVEQVGIEPWFLAVAGRGGQAPVSQDVDDPERDERVDVIVEYCVGDTCSRNDVWEGSRGSRNEP